jgi:hypothetical protein
MRVGRLLISAVLGLVLSGSAVRADVKNISVALNEGG